MSKSRKKVRGDGVNLCDVGLLHVPSQTSLIVDSSCTSPSQPGINIRLTHYPTNDTLLYSTRSGRRPVFD